MLLNFYLATAYNAWALNWDLQHSPEDYIKMEYNDLKKALVKPPKIIRTIKLIVPGSFKSILWIKK